MSDGTTAEDQIRITLGENVARHERLDVDADNALGAWPERDLLGTQLGPNKNGKKW